MTYKKINNLVGWAVAFVACMVFVLTMEPRGSFWDCGEFVSSAYKLQIPHAPGAPLFLLIGKVFTIFWPSNPAGAVNLLSALSSGFTVLFLYWSITHFARKIVAGSNTTEPTGWQLPAIIFSGIVGAFAYCFSDSQWYSAVEGEVYALSSFFTALVFWAILKWEHSYDNFILNKANGVESDTHPDRWIVFIFFMMGLSIGVHLLNLLTIPAIIMVIYYKRHENSVVNKTYINIMFYLFAAMVGFALGFIIFGFSLGLAFLASLLFTVLFIYQFKNKKDSQFFGGSMVALLIGVVITGLVQKFVIQSTIDMAGKFEVMFKNSLGLPFFTGFIFFFVLLSVGIFLLFRLALQKGWATLNLALWCTVFMLLGYSSYITTLVRSNANPAINMYNVNNPYALKGYLSREQYGDWPLIYGAPFTAKPTGQKTKYTYLKSGNEYKKIQQGADYEYEPGSQMFFVRTWDGANEQGHADYYRRTLDLTDESGAERDVTYGDQSKFFWIYQMNYMYWRYFMWNFAGKQNDNQGFSRADVTNGNWASGVAPIDNVRLGDQSLLPDTLKNNFANNKLYFLPLILGIIGLIYWLKNNKRDAIVSILLFFFTGIAIILYLNQAGNQPRERDYAFVGSFYAFCLFIGIGVLQLIAWASKAIKNVSMAAYIAGGIATLAVPVLMASQEWNDHDRSKKTLALATATAYLESCPQNAVLFCFGDNDTYPLWYAQEVEGIRLDVRVINTSLLGTDWNVNQQRLAINQSAPLKMLTTAEQVDGDNLNVIYYDEKGASLGTKPNPSATYDITDYVKMLIDPKNTRTGIDPDTDDEIKQSFFSSRNYSIPVDASVVRANGTVNATDSLGAIINLSIGDKSYLTKSDLAMLDIIASNKWERPICFTSLGVGLGLTTYLRKEGMVYRLTPLVNNISAKFNDYYNSFNNIAKIDTSFNPNDKKLNLQGGIRLDIYNSLNAPAKAMLADAIKKVWVTGATQGYGSTWGINEAWNTEILNAPNKFISGGVNLKGIYLDEENRRHALSLRDVFAETAGSLADNGKAAEATKILDKAEALYPSSALPYCITSRGDIHYRSAILYLEACYKCNNTALIAKVESQITKDLSQLKAFYQKNKGGESDLQSIKKIEDAIGIMRAVYTK